jgi:hypothetical protein
MLKKRRATEVVVQYDPNLEEVTADTSVESDHVKHNQDWGIV